jgi:hypothetical protein
LGGGEPAEELFLYIPALGFGKVFQFLFLDCAALAEKLAFLQELLEAVFSALEGAAGSVKGRA